MRRAERRWTVVVVLAAALYAAGAASAASTADFSSPTKTGALEFAQIMEASGLAASRRNANVLWVHNDSGDSARLFAMAPTGKHLGVYSLPGVRAVDWEDMAIGPGPEPRKDYLYIGDIGDNFAVRPTINVFRAKEPAVSCTQEAVKADLAEVESFALRYEDGPRDAETLMVDPRTGDLYIVTKAEKRSRLYRTAAEDLKPGGTATLRFVSELPWSGATAGDISPDGGMIIIRGYANASIWLRPKGSSVEDALKGKAYSAPLASEKQGEAICFDASGAGYYTVSEGRDSAIYHFVVIEKLGGRFSTFSLALSRSEGVAGSPGG